MSVTALWSKVTLEAVDTTPLPNNCQSLALFLESLSHRPGGASCHNFAQGMGLSFGGGFGVENRPANPSLRPISSRDECGEEDEKGPAQVVKVSIISFSSLHQKAICERHLTLLKDLRHLTAIPATLSASVNSLRWQTPTKEPLLAMRATEKSLVCLGPRNLAISVRLRGHRQVWEEGVFL